MSSIRKNRWYLVILPVGVISQKHPLAAVLLGPLYFDQISNFICLALVTCCGIKIVNYLDDFIVIGKCYGDCVKARNVVMSLLRYLGFYVSYSKVSDPSCCTVYLGIEIDSIAMELRLPEGKLQGERLSCRCLAVGLKKSRPEGDGSLTVFLGTISLT